MISTWFKILLAITLTLVLTSCIPKTNQPQFNETIWLPQGWTEAERQNFHYMSQGSSTFPVSYQWFLALERPVDLKHWFAGEPEKPFADPIYLQRFGFIRSDSNDLPIGFTKSKGLDGTENIGLTCAACHTGQLTYNRKQLLIDGGPGLISLDSFGLALAEALGETRLDTARLDRFGKAVYGDDYPIDGQKAALEGAFDRMLEGLAKQAAFGALSSNKVAAGFSRLDALNAIGNTVFNSYAGKTGFENMAHTDAPVNFPHIWTTSWFDWVQYDGSIMQPMIRNAGEALGVGAQTVLLPGQPLPQYSSAADIEHLYDSELMLAGEYPLENKRFTGLLAPKWPEDLLGELNQEKLESGKMLYQERCSGCHGPSIHDDSDRFWSDDNWQTIPTSWFGDPNGQAGKKYYRVRILPLDTIGTDSAQADVLAKRTLDLSGFGLEGDVCSIEDGTFKMVEVRSEPGQPFPLALGLVVQKVTERYYNDHGISPEEQKRMNGERPNCLQAGRGYKARPLNGIWATAPFLHNGSVPNLYEMLLPVEQRSPVVYLGYQGFDPERVGYISTKGRGRLNDVTAIGLTRVVVGAGAKHGDSNSGHEFSNNEGRGVIGREFTDEERWQLVEYLKSL